MKPDLLRIAIGLTFGLVPLVYFHDLFAFTLLPKRLVFFAGLTLMSLGWFLRLLKHESFKLPSPVIFTCLVGYLSVVIFSSIQTTHPLDSLVEIAFQLALAHLFFIATISFNKDDVSVLLWTIVGTGLLVSIIGILQYHNLAFQTIPSNGHPSATFGYRNFAAMYLIGAVPIAILLFLQSQSKPTQVLSILSASTITTFLIYTRTRGAWGGLIVATIIVLAICLCHPKLRQLSVQKFKTFSAFKNYALVGGLIVTTILAPLPAQFSDTGLQRFDEKKSDITSTVTSVFQSGGDRGRFEMWGNTLSLILDHPFFGTGAGSWKRIYPHYDNGVMIRHNSAPVRPHNDYLWIASEYGLVGLGLYLTLIITILITLYRKSLISENLLSSACFAIAILAILGHSFFSFPKEHPQTAMLLYVLGGIAVSGINHSIQSRKWTIALCILFTAHGIGATILTYRFIRFDQQYVNALIAEDQNDWQAVEKAVQTGLSYGAFRPHMWIIAGRSAEQHQDYKTAEMAYKNALQLAPYNWHAHNGLGIVYKRNNEYDKAQEQYQKALYYFPGAINPNAVGIRTNLGALYKSMGKIPEAEAEYRKILSTHPNHAGANNNMGNIYKSMGQVDSALVAYQTALKTDSTLVQAHFNLADLYLKTDEPQKALSHAETAARLQPNHAHTLWGLGMAYEANMLPGDALRTYQLALEIDPQHHQTRFNLANLYFDLGRFADAKHTYLVFIDNWQGDPKFIAFAKTRMIACENFIRRSLKQ